MIIAWVILFISVTICIIVLSMKQFDAFTNTGDNLTQQMLTSPDSFGCFDIDKGDKCLNYNYSWPLVESYMKKDSDKITCCPAQYFEPNYCESLENRGCVLTDDDDTCSLEIMGTKGTRIDDCTNYDTVTQSTKTLCCKDNATSGARPPPVVQEKKEIVDKQINDLYNSRVKSDAKKLNFCEEPWAYGCYLSHSYDRHSAYAVSPKQGCRSGTLPVTDCSKGPSEPTVCCPATMFGPTGSLTEQSYTITTPTISRECDPIYSTYYPTIYPPDSPPTTGPPISYVSGKDCTNVTETETERVQNYTESTFCRNLREKGCKTYNWTFSDNDKCINPNNTKKPYGIRMNECSNRNLTTKQTMCCPLEMKSSDMGFTNPQRRVESSTHTDWFPKKPENTQAICDNPQQYYCYKTDETECADGALQLTECNEKVCCPRSYFPNNGDFFCDYMDSVKGCNRFGSIFNSCGPAYHTIGQCQLIEKTTTEVFGKKVTIEAKQNLCCEKGTKNV